MNKNELIALGEKAKTSTEPTTIVFGTSGWRDRIGEGFTVLNVHKCVRAIIEMMKTKEFLKQNKYTSFDEVKTAGILVLRDNRHLGDTFIEAATRELVAAGIKVFNAGECPTGVGSAVLTELKAAGSINFTPSHNPMDYAGLKFNPADGGPAGTELTTLIEKFANEPMQQAFELPQPPLVKRGLSFVNAKQIYTTFLEKNAAFDMAKIRRWLAANKNDIKIIVDNFYGSSRGYVQAVLGKDVIDTLTQAQAIEFWHTEDNITFGGKKPEPSEENQRPLIDALKKSGRRLTLGVFMDPDADRIRFCDDTLDISMNLFGPIAFASLLQQGLAGGIATTVSSSDFGCEIARQNNREVFETPVGFKYFREPLTQNKALVAFEESDGISFMHHTLEKDAIGGFICALNAMMFTGKNLSTLYADLQKQYGYFYPDRFGLDVQGVSLSEWDVYKKKLLPALTGGLMNDPAASSGVSSRAKKFSTGQAPGKKTPFGGFKEGDVITVGNEQKKIVRINTLDGLKIIFDDLSWILLRASGTEPKFRIYAEVVNKFPVETPDRASLLKVYRDAGGEILEKAKKLLP